MNKKLILDDPHYIRTVKKFTSKYKDKQKKEVVDFLEKNFCELLDNNKLNIEMLEKKKSSTDQEGGKFYRARFPKCNDCRLLFSMTNKRIKFISIGDKKDVDKAIDSL